jgi:Na+/proline symporter
MITYLSIFLFLYFSLLTFISYKRTSSYDLDKPGYLIANRTAGFWESSLSIAGGWVLGGALFAVVEFTVKGGWPGLFWFLIPQFLGIVFFGWFSQYINSNMPDGYTLSAFMKEKYGTVVSIIYQICMMVGSTGLIILTMTSLLKYLIWMQIPNPGLILAFVTIGTLCYSLIGGLKTTILIGSIQMTIMLIFCILILLFALPSNWVDLALAGVTGKANYSGILDTTLLSTFGLSLGIISITGLLGNQCFYQKSLAQQNTDSKVQNSFYMAAIFWAVVPVTLALITLISSGSGFISQDIATTHLQWMKTNLGAAAVLAFGIIVLNVTANCLDAHGNAVGSIVANDWVKDPAKSVWYSRLTLIAVALIAWAVSVLNYPISIIILTYGIFRVLLFFITVLAVKTNLLNKAGIIISLGLISPIALYLNFSENKMIAALLAFLLTPVLAIAFSSIFKKINVK